MAFINKKPLRVNLNKALQVIHQNSSFITGEIYRPAHLTATSFLNFEEDYLQVEFKVLDDESFYFQVMEVTFRNSDKQITRNIYFKQSKTRRQQIIFKPRIKIDLKDVMLSLFHVDNNEFTLELSCDFHNDISCSVYKIPIPLINYQKKWIPNVIQIKYEGIEETTTDVKNLYFNDFELTENSSKEDIQLKKVFDSYMKTPWEHRAITYNLVDIFRSQLMIEDLKQNEDYQKNQLNDQIVQSYASASAELKTKIVEHVSKYLCVQKARKFLKESQFIEMTKNKLPFDLEGIDGIRLTKLNHFGVSQNIKTIKTVIDYVVNNETIIFKIDPDVRLGDRRFNVEFAPNRLLICMTQQALTRCDQLNVNDYLIDFESPISNPSFVRDSELKFKQFTYKNRNIVNNPDQEGAIREILNGSSFPSPYVLYGPPGTGKTTTIIESIVQILKLKPNAHILLAASNNTECNDIADSLMKYISCNKILRVYASNYERRQNAIKKLPRGRSLEMCGDCKSRYCNELHTCMHYPFYEEFYIARVVIVTIAGSGSLVNAGIRSDHFDYIFIDDATTIPESLLLIPIVGLATSGSAETLEITANIILSGDPSQLGPSVAHPYNLKLGMDCSMIERMLKSIRKYCCDTVADVNNNKKHVTQLFNSFRSHKAMLRFAYVTFYCGSQLRSRLTSDEESYGTKWQHLKNPEFPILFMDSQYSNDCEVFGKILMKKVEINVINYYIDSLLTEGIGKNKVLQEDIGVISMDLAQPNTIVSQLKSCYPNVEVGTVESFKGREKNIIFISTVRTRPKSIGFKRKDRRLIVALTRAKGLLVVVGNTDKLLRCDRWSKFIMYCINNNAFVDAPFEKETGVKVEDDDDNISSDDEEDSDDEDNYNGLFDDIIY